MQSESVAEIFHDVVAPCGETDDNSETAVGEDPNWYGNGGGDGVGLPDQVNGS